MATLNHGILTNAGRNLFNSVIKGDSKITYTKVVFCDDKELLNMSDDEIQDLTQINVNNSLETQPVSYNEGLLQGQSGEQAGEVIVRAIVSNAGSTDDNGNVIQPPLTNGFYPYVSALYASDGINEILYGLYLKDQPGYMPAYDGHTPQPLQFTWRLYASTTDNFNLSDVQDVYATESDLQRLEQNYNNISTNLNNNIKTGTLSAPKWLDKSTDLNNVTDAGVYAFWQGVKNAPNNGMLLVYNSQADDVFQVLYAAGGITYFRYKGYKNDFTQWVTMANNHDINNLQTQITQNKQNLTNATKTGTLSAPKWLDKSTDLNNVTDAGVYVFWQGVKNAPNNGMLLVYNSQADDVFQVLYAAGGTTYFRYKSFKNDFTQWVTMANNHDINNLQNQINNNYQIANSSAKNAMNQANSYTDNKINNVKRGTLSNPIYLDSNTNLNDITDSGVYYFWIGLKNAPTNGLLIVHNNSYGQIFQTLYGGNYTIYTRIFQQGGSSNWSVLYHQN